MKRPGITAQLFLAILGVTLAVVALMTVTVQLTFRNNFLDYVRERQHARVASLAEELAEYYHDEGGWQGLRAASTWRHMLREELWPGRDEDDDDDEHGHEAGDHGRGDYGSWMGDGRRGRAMHHRLRPALLDAAKRRIAGPAIALAGAEQIAIRVDGQTVGWLAFQPPQRVTGLALSFQQQQLYAAWLAALAVVVLAALVSLLLSRRFLAPVRRLVDATRTLAAGRFDTRVEVRRRDELGRLARDFNQLAATLERNEGLRRAFMADMSHELRTPLSVLRAELEAIEDGVRPFTRKTLSGLQASVAALSKLVDDLHELSLADAGALNYRMEPLDLAALVADLGDQWRTRLEEAGLTLTLAIPQAPVAVCADRGRLGQLLGNLLQNSLRYTDQGGRVRIALAVVGERAELRVEDSAPGVPDVALSRLFDRLYRVEGSRSRRGGGAGLGLAIGRRIVAAHGGDIAAYHAPAGGVGIRLTLPLAD